jgi:ATP-dependent Lon protease
VRNDLAMTGEITLRGRVLPIGGLKEKILAAHRGGVKTVLIPKENAKDVDDIPAPILKNVTLIQVDHMDEVLRHALVLSDPEAFFKIKPAALDYSAVPENKEELVDDEAEDDSSIPSPTNLS